MRKPNPSTVESDEDYVDRIISSVFRITVNPHKMSINQGAKLMFLPNLNEELNEAGDHLKFTISNLDTAILEAASNNVPHSTPLMDYFLPCWKRAHKLSTQSKAPSGPRFDVHEEARRLAMSNCLFALTMPDLYG